MICKKCGSPMVLVSSGRGLRTFACSGGCDCYESVETEDLAQPESEAGYGAKKTLFLLQLSAGK